ncbi:MAG: FAD-dependent oxidoreductase, partial [Alphaproteobacteria bacterium]
MASVAAGTAAEVLVVGGGMVGLTLACALADAGVEVVVVDGEDPETVTHAAFDGRVSAIAYASRRALKAVDLWAGMARAAEPILEIRVSDADSPFFLHYDHREVGDEPLGYIVENRVIRRA